MRVLSGRAISTVDRANASPVVVVNSALARLYWPNEAVVGQCLRVGADTAPCSTVIGVVSNTHRQDLVEEQPVPQLYRPLDQITADESKSTVSFFGYTLAVRTSGDAAAMIEPLRQALQGVNPNVPYANVQTMRMLLGRQTRSWELGARVFSAFGALALLLASVGLFSVVAFMLSQRVHEFGVRRALGTQSASLISLGIRRGMAPVVGGIGVGLALTLGLGRFVDPLLFRESSRDPLALSASVLVLFVAALVASVIPARRAAVVDPTIALRAGVRKRTVRPGGGHSDSVARLARTWLWPWCTATCVATPTGHGFGPTRARNGVRLQKKSGVRLHPESGVRLHSRSLHPQSSD